jgi:hypothetical protein
MLLAADWSEGEPSLRAANPAERALPPAIAFG